MGTTLAFVSVNDAEVQGQTDLIRKYSKCVCLFSGISCIVTVLVPEDDVTRTLLLFLLSKFLISASFLIIYPFAGELYPTQVRGVGIGTSSYIGGLGLMVIPFVTYLVRVQEKINKKLYSSTVLVFR